jgi:hypothetical protein
LSKTEIVKTFLRNDIPFGASLFSVEELTPEEKEQLDNGSTLMHRPAMAAIFNSITDEVIKKGANLKPTKVTISSNTTVSNENVENPFKTGDKVLYDGKPFEVVRAYLYKGKPYCILSDKRQVAAKKLTLNNKSKSK